MTRTSLAWALALSTALATPVLAQNQNDTTQPPAAAQPLTEPSMPAPAATPAPASGEFITQAQQGQYRGSKFVGVDIYNSSDENIGEVNELILDKQGAVQAVVIGVGGFLGIGEKNVALPFSAVEWMDTPRATAANANPPAATPGTGMATNTATTPDTTGATATARVLDYPDHGMVNMSKDQLQNAPEFKYASDQ